MKSSLGKRTSQTYTLHDYLLLVEPTTKGVDSYFQTFLSKLWMHLHHPTIIINTNIPFGMYNNIYWKETTNYQVLFTFLFRWNVLKGRIIDLYMIKYNRISNRNNENTIRYDEWIVSLYSSCWQCVRPVVSKKFV